MNAGQALPFPGLPDLRAASESEEPIVVTNLAVDPIPILISIIGPCTLAVGATDSIDGCHWQ
jgi:hypothetical protein